MISMILCNHCVIPQRMYKPSVPLCDAIDYLRSTWLKLSSVSTVNFPETGGRTVDAASLPVTAEYKSLWNSKPHSNWTQMVERCVTAGCLISKGVCVLSVLWFMY